MPPPSDEERYRALDVVTKEMLSKGLVGLHDAGVSMGEIEFFKRYALAKGFKLFHSQSIPNRAIDAKRFPIRSCKYHYAC